MMVQKILLIGNFNAFFLNFHHWFAILSYNSTFTILPTDRIYLAASHGRMVIY